MDKCLLGITVLQAAQNRIQYIFDNFSKIYVSFSGGKDSTVMLHLVMMEAMKRQRKIGVLFVDLEGQYKLTIEHIQTCCSLYASHIELFWIALPLNLRNAVSQYEPQWIAWQPDRKSDWIRIPPDMAVTEQNYFPFYKYAMEFEEFTPEFGKWYSDEKLAACFVGIRTQESLNRWRTISGQSKKQTFQDKKWTTWCGEALYNAYPVYDWKTEDIWRFHSKFPTLPYNKLYDRMFQAGLTIHQMRICQPYGDDQKKGLWLFHLIEPETWSRIVARVNGANQGALYAKESGNISGNFIITKPVNHSWKSFAMLLLKSMPTKTSEHFKNKIAVFLKWYADRGFKQIPDDGPLDKSAPSWKRICKALLRNDYWCKGLSFSQHKSGAYEKYKKLMERRRKEWKLI